MRPLIVANWKMNTNLSEALILANGVKKAVADLSGLDVVLCPPSLWLVPISEQYGHHQIKHLFLGAQNLFWAPSGAYTGEISATMLTGLVDYAIIGHSERRRLFHETDAEITKKVLLALDAGLKPILCVGELKKPSADLIASPEELNHSQIRQPLEELENVLSHLSSKQREQLIVAYEPVWAISGHGVKTEAAGGHYANQVAKLIKDEAGIDIPVLYGGSVKGDNAGQFLSQENINGLLVGGASLKVNEFSSILKSAV